MKVKTIVVALALFGQFFVNVNANHSIVQYEQPAGGLIKTITGLIEPMDNSSNVQIQKYITIMPQNVPALIQHTLLINVYKVEVEQFLNVLHEYGIFLREKNVALVEIGQKIMQLHILVLYSMFYSEFLKALQKLNSLELSTYRFEYRWLRKMQTYFAARYAKMKPNCLEYDKKPHGQLEEVDKFISDEVQPHLAKCDKLMQQFADQHQLLASEGLISEEKPSESQHYLIF
uniref:Uncharacterized protein n=1 Tax=Globodera rostochiensis TaxID=31243 RepID=A0A914IBQ7_GLORO